MIEYIIKSTICLAILYGVYEILFSRIKAFRFNRFLLPAFVIFSFLLPLVNVQFNIPSDNQFNGAAGLLKPFAPGQTLSTGNSIIHYETPASVTGIVMMFLAAEIYITALFILLYRFTKNISGIIAFSKSGERVKLSGNVLVLHDDNVCPYSFLKTIFVNRKDYESGKINEGLVKHETAHIKQLHSLDIIFIELITAFFWFNPLVYLYKRAIKLNHEYLADNYALENGGTVSEYSHMLLNFSSGGKYLPLISGINYSFIKKRVTMLLKPVSKNYLKFRLTIAVLISAGLFIFIACAFNVSNRIPDPIYNFSGTMSGYQMNDTLMYYYGEFSVKSETENTTIIAHRMKISNGLSRTKNYFENDFMNGKVFTDGVDIYTNRMFLDKIVSYKADNIEGSENSNLIKLKGNAEVKGEDVIIQSDEITFYLSGWRRPD